MKSYTWGYIKNAVMAMMDLDETGMNQSHLMNKIPFYANQAMTQICSAVKPHNTHVSFYVTPKMVNKRINVQRLTDVLFIGFRGRANYFTEIADTEWDFLEKKEFEVAENEVLVETQEMYDRRLKRTKKYHHNERQARDEDFMQIDYQSVVCKKPGLYRIGITARWWTFKIHEDDATIIRAPEDVMDAIMLYCTSELWSLEDEKRGSIYRGKFEVVMARIDDADYNQTTTFNVEGDW